MSQPPTFPPHLTPRLASKADHPQVAEFTTRLHPDWPRTAADLERFDRLRGPNEPFERLLLHDAADALAGWAEISVPRMDGHDGWLNIEVVAPAPDLAAPLLAWAEGRARAYSAPQYPTLYGDYVWERVSRAIRVSS